MEEHCQTEWSTAHNEPRGNGNLILEAWNASNSGIPCCPYRDFSNAQNTAEAGGPIQSP
jgi:hypothetical protein